MQALALLPYERSLVTGAPLGLHHDRGRVVTLDVRRWLAPADDTDRAVLSHAPGPVLDVGCGPGRIVEALAVDGVPALGIDIAATAVDLARARGVNAIRRDVFARVPGEGRWGSVVLLDGNIGIGGDPAALLARTGRLVAAAGTVVVETHRDPGADLRRPMRFVQDGRPVGPTFPWAFVGRRALHALAPAAGLAITRSWTCGGRAFTVLRA